MSAEVGRAWWTTERLERELRRGVSNKVRVLQALKESAVVRNEWDVLPLDEEDELQSIFDTPGERVTDVKKVLVQVATAKGLEAQIAATLHRTDRDAAKVFTCMREGVVEPRKIGARLGMSVNGVRNCAKRLRRRVEEIRVQGAGCRDTGSQNGTKHAEEGQRERT